MLKWSLYFYKPIWFLKTKLMRYWHDPVVGIGVGIGYRFYLGSLFFTKPVEVWSWNLQYLFTIMSGLCRPNWVTLYWIFQDLWPLLDWIISVKAPLRLKKCIFVRYWLLIVLFLKLLFINNWLTLVIPLVYFDAMDFNWTEIHEQFSPLLVLYRYF